MSYLLMAHPQTKLPPPAHYDDNGRSLLRERYLSFNKTSLITGDSGDVDESLLYNMLQVRGELLLLDSRPAAEFDVQHVHGACNVPPPPVDDAGVWDGIRVRVSADDLFERVVRESHMHDICRRSLKHVVIIAAGIASSGGVFSGPGRNADWGRALAGLLEDEGSAIRVDVASCTHDTFASAFPFLVVSSPITEDGCEDVVAPPPVLSFKSRPNEIVPGFLFLGNRRQAYDPIVIADLAITHIVDLHDPDDCRREEGSTDPNSLGGREPEEWYAEHQRHRASGVNYLEIGVDDEDNADITPVLRRVGEWIRVCAQSSPVRVSPSDDVRGAGAQPQLPPRGVRVLVHCNQGVSRSSACVMWYLMANIGLSFHSAWQHVLKRRQEASPNPGFRQALWEEDVRIRADLAQASSGGPIRPVLLSASEVRFGQALGVSIDWDVVCVPPGSLDDDGEGGRSAGHKYASNRQKCVVS